MILTNARCIFPEAIREGLEIVVRDGRIAEIRAAGKATGGGRIDLGGNYLAPGFIDLHIHGGARRDTMESSADAFRAICAFHASGGTTSLLLTTVTTEIEKICALLKSARASRAQIPQIAGLHLEGPFLSTTKPGAQNAELMRDPSPELVARLFGYEDILRRITIAPELPGALAAIDGFESRGISVSGGHSDAWDEEARAGFEHGMRSVSHTFNCMSSARRRGIYRVAGLLEFALSEPGVICELIADGHHVAPTLMRMLYRAKGTAGICLVTDATAGAGLPPGTPFSLGGLDCVVGDGVCLLADRSALAGSAARMIDLVGVMVRQVGVPLNEAVSMATQTPARAIGLKDKGHLAVGRDADLVLFSPEYKVLRTFLAGQPIFDSTDV
jgi:N-acetylglucosamine-6-phosphate deacetylase